MVGSGWADRLRLHCWAELVAPMIVAAAVGLAMTALTALAPMQMGLLERRTSRGQHLSSTMGQWMVAGTILPEWESHTERHMGE